MPDAALGFYFVQNGTGNRAGDIRAPLFQAFMDRYFPAPALPHETPLKTEKADGKLVSGNYIESRGSFDNLLTIGGLLGQAEASVNDDGTLSVDAIKDYAGNAKKFHEVKPFVWREEHGRGLLVAKTKDAAMNGQYELFKTSIRFDGTAKNPQWMG